MGSVFLMIDETDGRLLEALVGDSRMPLKELARTVGMSSPSVADRLRKLEDRGVVRAFTADLDPATLGYPVRAIIRIKPLPGRLREVEALIRSIDEIAECDKVTGDDCYVARVHLPAIERLDAILDPLEDIAQTNTAIIKSTIVPRRPPPLRPT